RMLDEIERRGTGGDDREAVLVGVDTAVDHRGAAARDRLGECLLEILLAVDDEASTAVGLCQGGVVREVMRELDLREPLLEEHVLPLSDHPEMAVVDQYDDDRQFF